MAESFYEKPILNSPYEEPRLHHRLDDAGQPVDGPPETGRRRSELISPVPKPRIRRQEGAPKQADLAFSSGDGISSESQEYDPFQSKRSNQAVHAMTPMEKADRGLGRGQNVVVDLQTASSIPVASVR